MCQKFAFCLLAICISFASRSQFGPSQEVIPTEEEKLASYPGGMQAFYEFVQRELFYPWRARYKSIQGKVFVEFIVTASGYIDPHSVKIIRGLDPSCDREVERVIKSITVKWNPGLDGRANPVDQKLIIPITFILDYPKKMDTPSPPAKRDIPPVKTVIIEKPVKADKPSWTVFKFSTLSQEVGRLMPGDSVDIIGWAPWCYQVKNNTASGYVSWKAVKIIPALDSLNTIIATQSVIEDKKDSITREQTYLQIKPQAHLKLTASKKEVFVGECFTVDLAFNVALDNQVRLRFADLNGQIHSNILPVFLSDSLSLITSNSISIVDKVKMQIGNKEYSSYSFFNVNVCPQKAQNIVLQKMPLYLARIKQDNFDLSGFELFESQPVVIKVKPLPPGLNPTQLIEGRMVGKFTMKETLGSTLIKTGEPVEYRIMIEGPVTVGLIEPPKIKLENGYAHLKDIISYDTIVQGESRGKKTLVYSLTFTQEGPFDLSGKIAFRFFDSKTASINTLRSAYKGVVTKNDHSQSVQTQDLLHKRRNLILVDGSKSMMIEDYEPNRFEMVKAGIANYLSQHTDCHTSLITFGGTARYEYVSSADSCYAASLIRAIDFNLEKEGTAIGDAIWFALNTLSEEAESPKLVVIGDGDNTAGWLTPYKAALYASKKNVQVYTIGVGHDGLVKFGEDAAGKPQMIDNTFYAIDLKKIASLTGGSYYWAKDTNALTAILADILHKP